MKKLAVIAAARAIVMPKHQPAFERVSDHAIRSFSAQRVDLSTADPLL